MPLTPHDSPGEVDAFGVRFWMSSLDRPVRCHAFRAALDYLEDRAAHTAQEILERFDKNRPRLEALASDLFDAGHRTPWISVVEMAMGPIPRPPRRVR